MGYIYRIYNDINDKCYIGLTTNTVETRWKKHLSNSSLVKYHLYDAMRLYGVLGKIKILISEIVVKVDGNLVLAINGDMKFKIKNMERTIRKKWMEEVE